MPPVKHPRELWLPLALMASFALTRIPGVLPLNFSAAYALAFCAGVYLPARMAWWLPLSVLLLTDVLLNLFYYAESSVSMYQLLQYVGYAVIILLGRQYRARSSWLALLGGGVLGALLFYLITNTVAWLQNPGTPRRCSAGSRRSLPGSPDTLPPGPSSEIPC